MSLTRTTDATQTSRPGWLTIRDFAEAKRVSTKTVRNWIQAGYITAERCGPRLLRIRADELDRIGRPIPTAGGAA